MLIRQLGPQTTQRLLDLTRKPSMVPSPKIPVGERRLPIVLKNESTEEVPPFGCCKVTGAEEFNGRFALTIDKPDSTGGPFVFNSGRAIPASTDPSPFGEAQSTAIIQVLFDDTSGTIDVGLVWGPLSDWKVAANGNPAVRIYGEFNEDKEWALGIPELGNVTKFGKTDAEVAVDGTGTVSIWREGADTTENIDDVNLDWGHGDEVISAGKEVRIEWVVDEKLWRFVGAECE